MRQNKINRFMSPPNQKGVISLSTTPKPGDKRENQTQNNHRGDGNVNFYTWPVYGDISGKTSQREFAQDRPKQTHEYNDNAEDDKDFLYIQIDDPGIFSTTNLFCYKLKGNGKPFFRCDP